METPDPTSAGIANAPADAAGRDSWLALAAFTSARVALGRAGGSLRTASLLDFRLAHARARDAVHSAFDVGRLERELQEHGLDSCRLATAASDRRTFLLRPDLGRKLDDASCRRLKESSLAWGRRDLVILVSDGLAAQAAERHAVGVIVPLVAELQNAGWSLFPILVVPYARVKLQDEVGLLLGARLALMLLGERPGLGSPDSLGAYFTYQPRADRTDADRNCISNIRLGGMPPPEAARKLAQLLVESALRSVSGVALKDTQELPAPRPVAALG
jgi:ethanolamine ammonia-lyase small subunit